MTATATPLSRADLTLYLVERAGGADMGGESRLALGRDEADRQAQEVGAGYADVVTVTPLAWGSDAETDALLMVDDIDDVLGDVFTAADALGLDWEAGRCDAYALLLGVREARDDTRDRAHQQVDLLNAAGWTVRVFAERDGYLLCDGTDNLGGGFRGRIDSRGNLHGEPVYS